ncbi:MAG: glycoside hydrolase family 16 protein [Clostridia bacterium]|nr:glycoside hydrolase family 16 protein [Clostridia bacterium]
MKRFEVKDHEPSYLPEGEWKLVWADEFDGTELDRTKWNFRLNFWGRPFEAYTDHGVILDGKSHVELHRTERDGFYVSPQLQTGEISFDVPGNTGEKPPSGNDAIWPLGPLEAPKFVHRYGYYECRCRFQQYPEEMWSAFWTQSPSIGTRFEPEWCGVESDIMEHFHAGEATTGNIMGGYGAQFQKDGRVKYKLEETEGGWHTFGMDWEPDGYVFYCDGKEISRCSAHVSHVPQFILLTTEVRGYRRIRQMKERGEDLRNAKFAVKGDFVDDAFTVDFVRVFDRLA